jgi:type I restriction enzyme, S subunit
MSDIDRPLPQGWEEKSLGQVCILTGGSQPPKSTFSYEPLPDYIRLVQIQDFRRDDVAVYVPQSKSLRLFDETDVMIGRYGPPVFQILRGLSGAYNVALMKATPRNGELTKNFLYYLLKHPFVQQAVIAQSQRSSGQSGVDKEFLENIVVRIPTSSDEQKRIASIIEAQITEVETARAALLAELEAAENLAAAFLRDMFEGEEAQGWERQTIGNFAKVQSGYAFKSEWYTASGVRLLRNANVFQGYISWNDVTFLPEQRYDEFKGFQLSEGDIVLTLDRPIVKSGLKVAQVGADDLPSLLVQRVGRFQLNGNIKPDYLYRFINSPLFVHAITGHDQSVGVPHISPKQVEAVEIPVPPLSQQQQIANKLKQQLHEIESVSNAIQAQLDHLDQVPAAILRAAFSGEL